MSLAQAVTNLDLLRIIEKAKEYPFNYCENIWIVWGGPNNDIIKHIIPLLIEPLEYYGLRRLLDLSVMYRLSKITATFYGLDSNDLLNIVRGLYNNFPIEQGDYRRFYEMGRYLHGLLVGAGIIR